MGKYADVFVSPPYPFQACICNCIVCNLLQEDGKKGKKDKKGKKKKDKKEKKGKGKKGKKGKGGDDEVKIEYQGKPKNALKLFFEGNINNFEQELQDTLWFPKYW